MHREAIELKNQNPPEVSRFMRPHRDLPGETLRYDFFGAEKKKGPPGVAFFFGALPKS